MRATRTSVALAVFLAASFGVILPALAGTCSTAIPMGAIEPARPIWCEVLGVGLATHVVGANSWVDDFEHHQTMASLNSGYVQGHLGNGDALHFQHNEHWMVDIESTGQGALIGAWMRPNRTFRPLPDGSVVIEFEVAGPIAGTRDMPTLSDSWPELVVSTAPQPPGMQAWGSFLRRNGTYLYEAFPGAWTFGCRMQQSKHPICALYNDDFGTAGTKPSRRWEINQNGGDVTFEQGGGPGGLAPAAWRGCTSVEDPDTVCRNMFRWTLSADRVRLDVNGVRFYEAGLINSELGEHILNAPNGFYVFFGDFAYRFDPGRPIRFHWDHLAVNPGAGSAETTPTTLPLTQTPTATQTASPIPATATATPTVTTQPTATPSPTATVQPSIPLGNFACELQASGDIHCRRIPG